MFRNYRIRQQFQEVLLPLKLQYSDIIVYYYRHQFSVQPYQLFERSPVLLHNVNMITFSQINVSTQLRLKSHPPIFKKTLYNAIWTYIIRTHYIIQSSIKLPSTAIKSLIMRYMVKSIVRVSVLLQVTIYNINHQTIHLLYSYL